MKHKLLLSATFAAATVFAQTENLALPSIGGTVFSAAGSNADAIKQVVEDFRSAIGNPLNAPGPNGNPAGRREINWDAVPDALSSPNALPADFFNKPPSVARFSQALPRAGSDSRSAATKA